jgi:hypothetical protein
MIEDSSPESDEKYSQQQQYHQVHHYPHQQHQQQYHHRKEQTSNRTNKKNFATMDINRSAIVEFNLLNHLEDIFLSLQTHDNFMTDIYWEVDTRFLNLSTVHASFPSAITMVVLYTVSQISIKFTKVVLRFFFEPVTNPNRCQYPELKNELLEGTLRILAIPSYPYVSGLDASSVASLNSPQDITTNNYNNNNNNIIINDNNQVNNNDSNNNNLIATSSAKSVKIRSFLMNRNLTGSFKKSFNSNNPAANAIANAAAAAAAAVDSICSGTAAVTSTLEADPETTSEKNTSSSSSSSSSGSVNSFTLPEDDHASCELGKYGFQPVTKVLGVLNGGVVHGEASVYTLLASVEGTNNPRELFTNYISMNYKKSDVMLFWVPCFVMFPSSEHDNISFLDDAAKNDSFAVQLADAFALKAPTVLRRVSLNSAPTTTDNSFASSEDGGDKFSMTMLINEKQQRRSDDVHPHTITADRNDSSNSSRDSKGIVGSNEVKEVSSDGELLSSDELKAIQSASNAVQSAHAESSSFSRNRQELHVLIVEVNI